MRAMETTLPLDRYAQLRAEIEAGRLRDDVLGRAGVSIDEWTAAQRQWLDRMGLELTRGRFELTNRYTAAFLDRQCALAVASRPPPAKVAEPAAAPAPEVAPAPAPELPSFLAAPMIQASPALPITPPVAPVIRSRGQALRATMSLDVASFAPALPFDAKPGAAPPAPPPPNDSALPFASAATPEPAGPAAASPPPPAAAPGSSPPPARTGKRALASTISVDASAFRAALPFDAKSAAPSTPGASPPPSPAPAPAGGLPFARAAAPAPAPAAAPAPAPASPTAQPAPCLTLEYYAAACAELAIDPRRAPEIFPRYGLRDAAAWHANEVEWQRRMRSDPAMQARFQALITHYRAYYARR